MLQVIENSLVSQHIHELDLQQERHDRTAAAHHSEEGYTWRRSPLRRERESEKNDKSLSKKCQDLELFNDAIIPTDTIYDLFLPGNKSLFLKTLQFPLSLKCTVSFTPILQLLLYLELYKSLI